MTDLIFFIPCRWKKKLLVGLLIFEYTVFPWTTQSFELRPNMEVRLFSTIFGP